MSDGTVTLTIDGYTVIAQYNYSYGAISYTVNNPDGSQLISAGDAFGLSSGLNSLSNKARAAGNTDLADQLFQLNSDLSSQEASIQQQVIDANKPTEPSASVTPPANTLAQTDQQNNAYVASGSANDETGTVNNVQTGANTTADNSGAPNNPPAIPQNYTNAGTTSAGASGTSAAVTNSNALPGKRLQNPLGNFSSYTYQISLYMITPDAYQAFVDSGRKNINALQVNTTGNTAATGAGNGAFLIAQSGGINNSTQKRAPYFDQDFYIDNLKITQAINGKDTGSATNVTDMSFNIIEPYGFSFLSRLRDAFTQLLQVGGNTGGNAGTQGSSNSGSGTPGATQLQDPSRQFFILGIQFLGYNEDGSLISSKDITGPNSDPAGNAYGVYARYYDINITELHFSLAGKSVVYACKAVNSATMSGMGLKRGIVWTGAEVYGETVDDVIQGTGDGVQGLLTKLNQEQQQLLNDSKIQIPNEYSLVYLGTSSTEIADAKIISPADTDKSKQTMSDVSKSSQVNEQTAQQATPNKNINKIKFDNGTPVVQAIEQIIKQSTYLTDALKSVITTEEEPNPDTDSENEIADPSPKTIKWYNIGVEVTPKAWDQLQQDFGYKIKYIIQPYETPIVTSAYVNKTANYYGPHKRYEYWFTGKNTEIIKYEQTLNNSFFNVTLDPASSQTASGGSANIPIINGIPQNQAKTGLLNQGMEAQNSYMTSLYDPGSWSEAKITILGDPDFLMEPNPSSVASVYNKYYGTDGYTVSPNGGQVFIEINFREPVDYNNNTGLFELNTNIAFYQYPPAIQADINSRGGGVSYMVKTVVSTFNQGKFTQELDLNINTFGDDASGTASGSTANSNANGRETSAANAGDNRTGSGSSQSSTGNNTSSTTGFPTPITQNAPILPQSLDTNLSSPASIESPTGQNTTPTGDPNNPVVAIDAPAPVVTNSVDTANQGGREDLSQGP